MLFLNPQELPILYYAKAVPTLFLILMGSLDCLTTIVGTLYFGTSELNPLIAFLLNSNISAFVVVKLGVTFAVAIIFILAEKALLSSSEKGTKSFKIAHRLLNGAYYGIIIFLVAVVTNNVVVLIQVAW
jgi:hypothetical protein